MFRTGEVLSEGQNLIQQACHRGGIGDDIKTTDRGTGMEFTDLVETLEFDNLIVQADRHHGGRPRTEPKARGAHAREDFSERDDARTG